jgi:pSer/pThr/pTyr-binding forkhead associated (FHA) protein
MLPITHFLGRFAELTAPQFEAVHPGPFLVHSSARGEPLEATVEGNTLVGRQILDPGAPRARTDAEVLTVFTTRSKVAAGQSASVGSGSTSALLVGAASVSRLHAILHLSPAGAKGGEWSLEDAESAGGTWLNGARLAAYERRRVVAGDDVRLGSVDLSFYPAASFHELVRSIQARGAR